MIERALVGAAIVCIAFVMIGSWHSIHAYWTLADILESSIPFECRETTMQIEGEDMEVLECREGGWEESQ